MKIIAESGLAKAIEQELLIPDPINIAKGVEIINNGTNTRTTTDNNESDRQDCS
jgi:hypothetical protein